MKDNINNSILSKIKLPIVAVLFITLFSISPISVGNVDAATLSCPFSSGPNRIVVGMSDRLRSDQGNGGAFWHENVHVPAGDYRITLFTYDSYSDRRNVSQPNESIKIQFKRNGAVFVQSNSSPDLADRRETATWQGVVNDRLTLPQDAHQVYFRNVAYPDTSNPNSLSGCVAIDRISDPEPEELDVQCRVSDTRVEVGESVTFTADVDDGRAPFDYDWSGDVNGNNIVEVESFNSEGSYNARITVTDANGLTASDDCPTVVVEDDNPEDFEVQCRVSDTRVEVGDQVRFSVDIDGGNSPFEYEWDGDIEGEDDDNSTLRVEYDDEGRYFVEVTVTDDDGNRDSDDCPVVVVDDDDNDDFDIQCRISDTSIDVGDRVTIEVDIDGGNSPYDIQWDGDIDDIDDFDDNDRSQRVEFDEEGRYDLEVEVEDDDGRRRTDECTIRVSDDDDRDINVFTDTTPTGTLAGLDSVFLNQIPYTGPKEDLFKILSFTFLVMIWSAIISVVFYKRRQKTLRSQEINQFKEFNRLS